MNLYRLQNVACRRGDFTLRVHDWGIEQGSLTCITGPNGSGKTTLLNLLAFVDAPAAGTVEFVGEPVAFDNAFGMLQLRRGVGCLMQHPYLFNMSVYDNIAYGLKMRGVLSRAEIRRRVYAMLERLALIPLSGRNAHRLSGGEAQRVAVARALVLEADVLILDEPTSGVDHEHFRRVEALILEANRNAGTTVVLSTHSRKQAWRLSGSHVSVVNGELHDMVYENVFTGIMRAGRGCMEIAVDGIVLKAGEGAEGPVIVAIDPQNVLISTHPLESSALNHFKGPVSRIEEAGGCLRVLVDIGVPLCASITRASYDALNLRIGGQVDVTFKATAVKVL